MGNKSFKDLTTFKVGGEISHYLEASNRDDLVKAVRFAKSKNLPIFILGGGSDILVSDNKFDGAVVKYTGVKTQVSGGTITAEANVEWDDLVKIAVEASLQGIECLSGIPGTVGASPIQNIGAYGQELKDTFVSLTAYDIKNEKFETLKKDDCLFAYRESCFKKPENWQKYVITDVRLQLTKNAKPTLTYESLKNYLRNEGPSLKEVRKAVLEIRKTKFENPKEVGNAGSFFKNPIVGDEKLEELRKKYPDLKAFRHKIAAGWLIEKAGWKGKTYKNAGVSPNHALVLVNKTGKAKAEEIQTLSQMIIDDVDKKFGIRLEREVQLINFPKKVAIVGYGIEGQDAEKYFREKGDEVTILDRKVDKSYLKNLGKYDLVVRSPGVYPFKPEFKNVKVTTPIQIFLEECKAKIIGVTGTKGKGTTASLIYEILKKAGKDAYLAGNIGKPYLGLLPQIRNESLIVLEMSSFQLIDITKSPHIAVVLNITSDHMDWHKSQKEYVDAKKSIVAFQEKTDLAIVNQEYEASLSFAKITKAKVIFFSKQGLDNKFKEGLLLRGEHNLENIAAAVAVAQTLGIQEKVIQDAVKNFKGLEHRLELVGEVSGRSFYNDSFATGPQPTIAAVKSFTEPTTLILGGSDKGLDYGELRRVIEEKDNIRNLILIGEIGEKIAEGIEGKNILNLGKTTMQNIVEKAFEITPKGGVVLLSPAAASFDMFENYKDRGNQFKEAVRKLK